MFDSIHEECGVFGIYTDKTSDVAAQTYVALYALQHRGQESCGIVVNDDGVFRYHKNLGLVNQVFDKDRFRRDMGGVEDAYQEMMKRVTGAEL